MPERERKDRYEDDEEIKSWKAKLAQSAGAIHALTEMQLSTQRETERLRKINEGMGLPSEGE